MKTAEYTEKVQEIQSQLDALLAEFASRVNDDSQVDAFTKATGELIEQRTQLFYKWAAGPQD
jgi:hypothetical protein